MDFGAKLEAQTCRIQILSGSIIVQEIVQHNLVLTNASELIPLFNFENLSQYAVLGSGSSAPAVGQTTLVTEVVRTNNVGGGADTIVRTANGVYEKTVYREFTEAQVGGLNFREWGFSPTSGVNSSLISRELFRDGGGIPITLSPDADQRIRMIYTTRITLLPVTPVAGSINITGVGSRTGTWQLHQFSDNSIGAQNMDLETFNYIAKNEFSALNGQALSAVAALAYASGFYTNLIGDAATTGDTAYVAGSKTRKTSSMVFDSSQANGTIAGFVFGSKRFFGVPHVVGGIVFKFDAGQEIVKTNLQKLTVAPFSVAWT